MVLKGQKVILRPIQLSDAERFVKWFNDPEVNKFLNYRSLTLKAEREYIKNRLAGKIKDTLHFCIDATDGTHIGGTALESVSKFHRRGTFGIVIGNKNYWDKGYGSDVMRTILNYGFKKLKLHRIEWDVYAYNARAIKVYKRMGAKIEGIKREHVLWKGKFYNAYHMSILDREWKQNKTAK